MARMTVAEYLGHALALPGAWADQPWEGDLVAKVGDKIFLFTGEGSIGVKCGRNRLEADEWIAEFPGDAAPMPYLARYGWNSLVVGGGIPDGVLLEAVDAAYEQIVSRLPRSQRPARP